jgi:hypothetical protein
MCLRQRLKGQLSSAIAAGRPTPWSARLIGDHSETEVEFVRLEQLAVEAGSIHCRPNNSTTIRNEDLKSISDRLAKQVTYLLEAIGPVELDADSATILMRSVPPSQEDADKRAYYEVIVRPKEIGIRRFECTPGQPRKPTSMILSVEVLARLIADLDGVL